MKREAFGDDGPTNKRPRATDDEVTFLIPSKVAGSIIGKGGLNISKLRNQGGPKGATGNEEMDIRLLIHQSRAGCVIGKAGAKIKELREKTGARLKIFSNAAPQSTERVVQLVGKKDAIAAGIREVIDLIRQTPIKGAIQNYDPHNYDDFYAEEYGGFGVGQGGGAPPRGGPPRGGPARGGPPPRMPMGPGPSAGLGGDDVMFGGRGPPMPRGGPMGRNGPPGPGPRAPFNDFAGPGPRPNFSGPPRGAFGGAAPGGGFGGGGGGNFPPNRPGAGGGGNGAAFNSNNGAGAIQQETTTQVTIPKDLAGAIIGKAGSRIRKIRADSGAGIEIAEPLPGSNERIITITGTPQRIQTAQYLLQQSVHESHPNLGGGRGGNF